MPRRGNEMMHAYIYTQEHEALTHTHETILVVYILLGAKARSLLQILSSRHGIILPQIRGAQNLLCIGQEVKMLMLECNFPEFLLYR